jgi:hypothetical protein
LDAVGAPELKEHFERVAGLFAGESIKTVKSRNEVIKSWRQPGRDRREIDRILREAEEMVKVKRDELDWKLHGFLQKAGIAS